VSQTDGQTGGQTSYHGIVRAMHMRRAVKIPIGKSPKTYAPRSKFPKDIIPVNKIPAEDASRGDKILPAKAIM